MKQSVKRFTRWAGSDRLVWSDRLYRADCETAFGIFRRLTAPEQTCFLLESVEGGETWARFSFMGVGALVEIIGTTDRVTVRHLDGREETLAPGMESVRGLLKRLAPEGLEHSKRFFGGAVGYVAYDAVRLFERLPDRHAKPAATLFRFIVPQVLCVYDNLQQDLHVIAFANPKTVGKGQASAAAERLGKRLDAVEETLSTRSSEPEGRFQRYPLDVGSHQVEVGSNFDTERFVEAVQRSKDYILAGDIFQVVVSQCFEAHDVELSPLAVYRRLRRQNPSPYLFFLNHTDETLIGASPEVMVRLTGTRAEVRPIAGTRPRGQSPEEDEALARELLSDPKELAEHVMLLDLGRNDLGRVCEIGSIVVQEQMVLERYSKVMHLVSHVAGRLRPDLDWLDLLGATFPAGTLTGAPKIRAMEIIDELEPTRRGVYGGAVGYIGFDDNMDFCIAIRTLHVRDGRFVVQAGAGIVADSIPEREYEESVNKATALLQAVGADPP